MLQAFVITLREGLEAFLIVAISLAYLRKSGQSGLIPAVRWGIVVAVLLSVGLAYLFQKASNQALWEGVLAILAAVLVSSLIGHMWRHAPVRVGATRRDERLRRRLPIHAADDFAGGDGNSPADGDPVLSDTGRGDHPRCVGRHVVRRRRGRALVAVRPPRKFGPVLPGHRGVSDGVRGAVGHLRVTRADRSERLPLQRAAALGHRALRPRRPVRAVLLLPPGAPPHGMAPGGGILRAEATGAGAG